MDYISVLDMLDRTFVDRINAKTTFETASESVRTEVAIEGGSFRVAFTSSGGANLVVTPQRVIASDGTSSHDVSAVDTDAAFTAWTSQPPTSYAPLAAGLQQLTTSNAAVNQIIGQLSAFSGSLGIGIFPSLCWYSARYPSLSLGDVQLVDVEGRICLHDVNLSTERVSFSLNLNATAASGRVRTVQHLDDGGAVVGEDVLKMQTIDVSVAVSAYLNLVDETAEVTISRANFDCDQLDAQFGPPPDPWRITASRGLRIELENVRQKMEFAAPLGLSTRGRMVVSIPEADVSKAVYSSNAGTVITFLAPTRVKGLRLGLDLDQQTGRPELSAGKLGVDQLTLRAHYQDKQLSLQSVAAMLLIDSFEFSSALVETEFSLFNAVVAQAEFVTGPAATERLSLQNVSLDVAGDFSDAGDRTILFLEKMHVVAAQGTWRLVLESVNGGNPADPLSLRFSTGAGNAIDFFAQNYLSVTGLPSKSTAERVQLLVREAATAAPIHRLILSQYHVLTTDSFNTLRTGGIPNAVLAKFESELTDVRFETREELLAEVRDRLTASEFSTHGATIDAAAVHHETYLANADIDIDNISFEGSFLEMSQGSSQLHGDLIWALLELTFDEAVGLELPNVSNLSHVVPIQAGDRYPVADAKIHLPRGSLMPGVAALSQQFTSADVDIGGSIITINPGSNRVRFNLLPQLPVLEGVVAQLAFPSATITVEGTPIALSDARVDVYRKTFTPGIGANQRGLLYDTAIRFGIVAGPIVFPIYHGGTRDISIKEAGISLLETMLTLAGIPVPHGAFDVIRTALDNPLTDIAGDLGGMLGSLTGFGLSDFGIRVETNDVTAQVEGFPDSNRERVAVSVRFHFPKIGAYVKYHWKEPRIGFPPWEEKEDSQGFVVDLFPVDIKLMLLIDYRVNAVTHSVDITDIRVKVIPATGTPADLIISEAENLFDAIVPTSLIRQAVVQELNKLFKIALPDGLNLDLARIDFDAQGRMTASVEARQLDWNSLA
jgi:hypothetical protein